MTTPTTAQPVTIELSWWTPPLNLNDHHTRYLEARIAKEIRTEAGWQVRAKRIGAHPHIRVELRYQPQRRGRRDEDNLGATLKHLCDGIVDAGVVPDDTADYMTKVMPAIVAPARGQRHGRMWLIITPQTTAPPPATAPDA